MITKKYVTATISEAQEKIFQEMGPNAMILTSRQIKYRGLRALFSADKVEIVAAVDEEDYNLFHQRKTQTPQEKQEESPEESGVYQDPRFSRFSPNLLGKIPLNYTGQESDQEDMLSVAKRLIDRFNQAEKKSFLDLEVAGPICLKYGEPTLFALFGPSGVGKSSLGIKILLQYREELGKKVAMVFVKNEKIGELEAIQAYAAVYDIPFFTITSRDDIISFVQSHRNFDLLLVDGLKEPVKLANELHVIVVLSATTKEEDNVAFVSQNSAWKPQSLAFTKLDETTKLESIAITSKKTNIPVSYLSIGSAMNDTLIIADPETLDKITTQRRTQETKIIVP